MVNMAAAFPEVYQLSPWLRQAVANLEMRPSSGESISFDDRTEYFTRLMVACSPSVN
jgi:hypothetical protein